MRRFAEHVYTYEMAQDEADEPGCFGSECFFGAGRGGRTKRSEEWVARDDVLLRYKDGGWRRKANERVFAKHDNTGRHAGSLVVSG